MSMLPAEPDVTSAEDLASMVQSNSNDLIVIDVRPYSAFALSHILHAVNVRLSNILMRRLAQGKIAVEDLLQEPHKSAFLNRAARSLVVVYDERATMPLDQQDTKMIVISALRSAGRRTSRLNCLYCYEHASTFRGHGISLLIICVVTL